MTKIRAYSKYTEQAVSLLSAQIKLKRKQRKWTEQDLAERAGISRVTLRKIESGKMSPAIGLVFELAGLVGINLFEQDNSSLAQQRQHTRDQLALLPQRIQPNNQQVDDEF